MRKKPLRCWIECLILVGFFAYCKYKKMIIGDGTLALSMIVFSFLCVSQIPYIREGLEYIGKHSANIFFFHTFLYLYNFKPIVYAPKYAPLILLIFVGECVLVSVLLEYFKKFTRIEKGIGFIGRLIEGKQ